jgi:hypothetical protein
MQRNKLLFTLIILSLWATVACAVTVNFITVAPSPGANDISNLVGAALDRNNVGGDGVKDGTGNDGMTYVAMDRPAQGQTFAIGVNPKMVTGVWIRHVGYTGNNPGGIGAGDPNNTYYAMPAPSQLVIRITNPAAAGTAGFVLANETAAITGTETDVLPAAGTNSADGTGTWIHVSLSAPVVLAANTTYGFDFAGGSGLFFETLGISDSATGGNPYTAGSAYNSGSAGAGNTTMTAQAGDRVFIVELIPYRSGASNPTPANAATGVDSDAVVTLSWDAGKVSDPANPGSLIANPNITNHYVYLSLPNDPNLAGVSPMIVGADTNPANGIVDPSASKTLAAALDSDATYYWRVDEIMKNAGDPNNITGPVWSFDTEKKKAQFNPIYPQDVALAAGEQATFTVTATNPFTGDNTGMTYQWYRNTTLLTGQTGYQYVRTALAGDDRSTYYCVVTITSNGRTAQSRTATLYIKKQIAYWTLDGNANDSAPDHLYNGTLTGGTSFVTDRKVGTQALSFNGTDGYVDEPNGFDSFGGGLTFTLWAKPTAAGTWARFMDFGNGAPSDNIYFSRNGTTDTLFFGVFNGTTLTSVEAANILMADEWQMLTVTMDRDGNVVMYKNGAQVQTGTVSIPSTVTRTINYIGRSNWTADAYYQGLMDDIQVFNYAKTADEIAQMYYAVMGAAFCQEYPIYDFTGPAGIPDCRVDIYELRGMAADWLGCGLYPDCL